MAADRDMSAQRHPEEELSRRQVTEEQFTIMNKILSATADFVYLLDPHGRYLFASKIAAELLGISQSDFLGKTWQELDFPAEFMAPFNARLQAVMSSGHTVIDELLFPVPAGNRWFEYVIKPMLDQQGAVESVIVSSRDITERRQAADALRRLASIVESSSDAIFSKTLEGVITSWNHGAETLFGYQAEEIIGQPISLLFPPGHSQELIDILTQIKRGEPLRNLETMRVKKDGTCVAVSVTISPLQDHQGYTIGASTIARDITEQKRAEDALRESRDELAAVNAALEEASLVRNQFLATMSHELRTPLASITGYGEMLLEDAQAGGWSQQHQSSLEKILNNSEHLLGLINDVLDLSKMEAGRMLLDYSWVDVRSLLSEVAAAIGSLAIKRNLFLRIEVEEGLGPLETNQGKLHQILLNLVFNALKFTEHGGVTLSASRVLLSYEGTEGVAFAVQDSGIGIPADLHERIFKAFYQTDMSYTRRVGGTGLGLSIVSQLTALLGGTVTIASAPGQGSTFTVTLPVKAAQPSIGLDFPRLHPAQQVNTLTPPPAACEFAPAPSPDALDGFGQRDVDAGPHDLILAVDDNPDAIAFIKDALRDTLYTVMGVQDPLQVMGLVRELHPCAITLDVMMPQLNGWQLLHQLKDNPATASIPVVILSVLTEQTTGYVLGADHYLIKPFKKEALCHTLERLLGAKQGPPAASKYETPQVARGD